MNRTTLLTHVCLIWSILLSAANLVQAQDTPQLAPLNPEFIEYMQKPSRQALTTTEGGFALGGTSRWAPRRIPGHVAGETRNSAAQFKRENL